MGSLLLEPLFVFSGACSGCGESHYLKLLTQLFGDRMITANARGCSSIFGGNLPTTPWSINHEGKGPAWANSLFEDNAEFGLGIKLATDKKKEIASHLLKQLRDDARRLILPDGIGAEQQVLVQARNIPMERSTFQQKLY